MNQVPCAYFATKSPYIQECIIVECILSAAVAVCLGVSAQRGVCPSPWGDTPPPLNGMTDKCLWKYYLATTLLRRVKMNTYWK